MTVTPFATGADYGSTLNAGRATGTGSTASSAVDRLACSNDGERGLFRTIQGEGPSLGRQALFLRLAGCNLHCSWCDTPYTWDWSQYSPRKEVTLHPVTSLAAVIHELDPELLVVTGGEPLLQQRSLRTLFTLLDTASPLPRIEVETNGTVMPIGVDYYVTQFNVSPKLQHAGNPPLTLDQQKALQWFAVQAALRKVVFKFVVQQLSDLDEVEQFRKAYGIRPYAIWIMPEGTTAEGIAATAHNIATEVVDRGWNLTTRLHVQLWGARRGV